VSNTSYTLAMQATPVVTIVEEMANMCNLLQRKSIFSYTISRTNWQIS